MLTLSRRAQINSRWLDGFIVAVIVLLAAFFRLYRLDQLPPGLHFDEAFNATMAQRVLSGVERPIYFTEDLTEEPMAIYLTALAFGIFGASPWSIRLVSALAGIATVAVLYFLARALFQSRWIAALAAFVLTILYWHVNFSRLGMEPIFVPLTMTLAFGFLWHAIRPNPLAPFPSREGGWGIGGFFLAATQYTYKAALFVPILFVAFIGLEILIDRDFWARHGRGLVICVAVAVLVFAPLGLYLATYPAQFFERPSTVTATSPIDHAVQVAGMFFVQGDENPRSNLPGRPALDPFLAIGFIAGIAICIARIRKTESRFLLLWLVIMSLPSVLTDFAPHFGRNIGTTPAIALIVAYGFSAIVERVQNSKPVLLLTVYCLLLSGFAFSTITTFNDYFNIWGLRTGAFDSFDVGQLALAQKLRDRPADELIYLSPVDTHHYTIQFGLAGRAASSFDGRSALVVPAFAATYGIITRDDSQSITRLQSIFERGRVVETINDWTGKPYASIYRAEGAPRIAPQTFKRVDARLGEAIDLLGYDIARTNQAIDLSVYWRSRAATREDYTVFVQLIGAAEPVAQSDAQPGRGSYPTSRWRPGELIIDNYRLTLPDQLPRGEYALIIGMYNLTTGARVRVFDANGAPMENDRVIIERITLP